MGEGVVVSVWFGYRFVVLFESVAGATVMVKVGVMVGAGLCTEPVETNRRSTVDGGE